MIWVVLLAAALPADMPCSDAVARTLAAWDAAGSWSARPRAVGGPHVFASPTREIGVWTEVHVYTTRVEVVRVRADHSLTVRFDAACNAELSAVEREVTGAAFTDADVVRALAAHERGVFFVWSPHMPLSAAALVQMRKAAGDAPVYGILDPFADEQAAKEDVAEHGLKAADLLRLESVELVLRNMTVHYPSALRFENGQIIAPLRLGYEQDYVYEDWLGGGDDDVER